MSFKNKRVFLESTRKKYITENDVEEDDALLDDALLDDATTDEGGDRTLTDSQNEIVEDWVDDILASNLSDVDSTDLNGSKTLVTDLPISAETFQDIIEQDDSLSLLQNELETAALGIDDLVSDELTEEIDREVDFEDEEELDTEFGEVLRSDKKAKKAFADFEKDFSGEFDELENDALDEAIKELEGMVLEELDEEMLEETAKPEKLALKNEYSKINNVAKTKVVTPDERNYEVLKTTKDNFERINKKNIAKLKGSEKLVEKLQLENYALQKTNSLLILGADTLSESARVKLTEAFLSCENKQQIDNVLKKMVVKLQEMKTEKTNLKESVNKKVSNNNEKVDFELERKKHLMGFKTKVDVYNS